MTGIESAIEVTHEVEVDWAQLGRVLAEQMSPHQADFIMGFFENLNDMQLAYIGSERVFDGVRDEVGDFLSALASHIDSTQE